MINKKGETFSIINIDKNKYINRSLFQTKQNELYKIRNGIKAVNLK